ncbi:twin-arginine translocation signal domain-containing protein [Haloarcula laminariae]|uniref:twin-arginine translocation signal domain-containing protein n=1 Tax=Haloarcula laminariae TaxID=2961577 RepID=UPI0021C760C5|nr:twin-arginine translocation signal domain-containing protein [Halomicroarcula laminariae]
MNRRRFLASAGVAGASILAGCGSVENQSTRSPPLVENRPDATYYPTHKEGMKMIGVGDAGDYKVGLTYSYPHRFWTVTGTTAEQVTIQDDDSVHLMASVWDPDTMTVLPIQSGVSITVSSDGETVADKQPWPMVSQNMGFHYGDNYQLDGEGVYEMTVRVDGMTERRLGGFADRFGDAGEMTTNFEFSRSARDDIAFTEYPDQQGSRAALDLMKMEMMPTSQVPAPDDLPGELLGTGKGSDEVYAATWLSEAPFLDSGQSYLAVSVRTPYNRVPLPMMSIDGAVDIGGETAYDDSLSAAVHPDIGYHYGAVVEATGDPSVTVETVGPSQVSRHEGYETAFLGTPTIEF